MGIALELAVRYLGSRKRASVSVGTVLTILGVMLGVGLLVTAIAVSGGFRAEFQKKVLGVNAHVLVLKYAADFPEYREVMDLAREVPGVTGVAPFVISPMMITRGEKTATGVLLKGVDPELMPKVLDLPEHIVAPPGFVAKNGFAGLRLAGSKPPVKPRREPLDDEPPPSVSPGRRGPRAALNDAPAPSASVEPAPATSAVVGPVQEVAPAEATEAPAPSASAADPIPVGSVTPDGGYSSELPPADDIPEGLDGDPCAANNVKALPGIIIGATLQKQLGAQLGDCVQVTSPTIGYAFGSQGEIRAPVAKQFRILAIFDSGFDQYDGKLVYTDLYEAMAFHDGGDSVTGVELRIADVDASAAVSAELDRRLRAKLGSRLFHTMDWAELNRGLFTALLVQQIIMTVVLSLVVLVASFTVVATLIMVVLDKKREIAVLKAMGATDFMVLRTFTYQGVFIGLTGTTLGLGLGFGICKGLLVWGFPLDPKVYFISRLPVLLRTGDFIFVAVFALLICLLSSIGPALYASLLRPAQAFRES